MAVKHAILYGSKCWPIEKGKGSKIDGSRDEDDQMDVWLQTVNNIRNEVIRDIVKVAPIEDKKRET